MPEEFRRTLRRALEDLPARSRRRLWPRATAAAIAAALALFLALPNLFPQVAEAMERVPGLEQLMRVVTIREWDEGDDAHALHVKEPEVQGEGGAAVNEAVDAYVAALLEDFDAEEGARSLDVSYAVVTDTADWFTLRIDATRTAGGAEDFSRFYHIDKATGERVQLSDLFPEGTDYVSALSEEVRRQMQARLEAGEEFFPEAFDAIDPEQNFYWGADGTLYLVFDEYSVAPGSMGMPEFAVSPECLKEMRGE